MKFLTVRERALRAVIRQLLTIQEPAFGYTIKHVRRQRSIVELADDPPEIHMMFTGNNIQHRTDSLIWNKLPVELWYYVVEHNYEPDTVANIVAADVQKVLACETVFDTTGGPIPGEPCGHEIHCENLDDQPFYVETEVGQVVGRLIYEVWYSYLAHDPYRWDSSDSLVPLI